MTLWSGLEGGGPLGFGLVNEKKALTPIEFAACFGKKKWWSYKLIYAGKVSTITEYSCMMIPTSEVARIESEAGRYTGKKVVKKTTKEIGAGAEPKARGRASGGGSKAGQPSVPKANLKPTTPPPPHIIAPLLRETFQRRPSR